MVQPWTNIDSLTQVKAVLAEHDPRNIDTDGVLGLTDGQEYWGWFADSTDFSCQYLNEEYICDDEVGDDALEVHLSGWLNSESAEGELMAPQTQPV